MNDLNILIQETRKFVNEGVDAGTSMPLDNVTESMAMGDALSKESSSQTILSRVQARLEEQRLSKKLNAQMKALGITT